VASSEQHLDIMGLPRAGRSILHCTLLLKGAGQEKFATSGTVLPGPGPEWARTAGSPVKEKTSLVGA